MVVALEQLRPLTIDDLADFPDDGMRREIVTGELVVTPAPSPIHQLVSIRLIRVIDRFVIERELGFVYHAPIDVELSINDIVEPDLVFIAREHAHRIGNSKISGPPDLVIEILSPATRRYDIIHKRALYARSGITEYWIVDPDRKSYELLTLSDSAYVSIRSSDGMLRSKLLPDLTIDPVELFGPLVAPQSVGSS